MHPTLAVSDLTLFHSTVEEDQNISVFDLEAGIGNSSEIDSRGIVEVILST